MKVIVKHVELSSDRRTIVMSDIHGNLELFQDLLCKINYCPEDVLILLGDITEKGERSLDTVRYIMELTMQNTVHIVSGNCDTLWEDVKYDIDDEGLLRYMVLRKNCILNEMCQQLSIEVSEQSDIKHIKSQLLRHYSRELDWLEQLPHIIETQHFIFAHAGVFGENLEEQEAKRVMRNSAFMELGLTFSKYIVVGHWPVVLYGRDKPVYNPIINRQQRIISIDGGNVIKREGQLNALIIEHNDPANISYECLDHLPKGIIVEDQEGITDSIFISFMDDAVEVLEEGTEFSLCSHSSSKHQLWIKNTMLYSAPDGVHCQDCTDYVLPLFKGDIVSIIEAAEERTLVKKDGIVGWVANHKLQANDQV